MTQDREHTRFALGVLGEGPRGGVGEMLVRGFDDLPDGPERLVGCEPRDRVVDLRGQVLRQTKEGFGEADLTVGAVFEDLMLGFTAVQRVVASHRFQSQVRVFEAFGGADPLAFLRPSSPRLRRPLCSVVVEAIGDAAALRGALAPLLHYEHAEVARLLGSVPAIVMSGLERVRAERAAALLREAGATVAVKEEVREP
jgi:hypothetical protein